MTDSAGSLTVTINGRDVNLMALLRDVRRQMQETDSAAGRTGRTLGSTIDQGARQGEAGMLRLQSALARNQAQAGDTEGAIQRLRTALSGLSVSTPQTIAAEGQLARLEQAATRAATAVPRTTSALQGLQGVLGAAGLTFGAAQILQGAVALTQAGAQAEQVRTRFDALASAAHTTGDALLTALRAASGGEISDLNLQLAANRANMLGVADSAEQLATLMAIARDRAQTLGTTATDAFNDLVTGLGRGSPLILDNLGIMVSVKEANEAYAQSVGKTVAALSEQEQKQALINAVLAQGQASLAATGGAADTTASSFKRLGTAADNAGARMGAASAKNLEPAARGATVVLQYITDRMQEASAAAARLADANAMVASSANYQDYVAQVQAAARASGDAYGAIYALSEAQYEQTKAAQGGTTGGVQWAAAQDQATAAAAAGTAATQGITQATLDELLAKQQGAAATQELTLLQADLANLAPQVAGGLVSDANAANALAARYGIAYDMALKLIAAQAELARATGAARLAGQAGATTTLATANAGSAGRRGAGDDAIADVVNLQRSRQAAAQAERAYQEAVGGTATQLKNVRSELAGAVVGSKEYYDLKRRELELTRQTTRAPGGGAGGGKAAAARKENTQALAAQQKYNQDSADLERDHQQTLAQIAEDGAKKRQQALERLDQSRTRGRVDFYRRLADVEDAGQRAALSQQFETIEQETAQLAQTQGADVASAYRDAAITAAEAQADIQSEIRDAQAKGDDGRAEYLHGILRLQQDADAKELARIRDHGSAIAAEQQQRYAAEEQQYAEHLDRMATTYQQKFGGAPAGLGAPAPGVPIAAVAGSAPVAPAASQPAPVTDTETAGAVVQSGSDLAARVSAVESAVREVKTAVDAATSAVRSLAQRGVKQG